MSTLPTLDTSVLTSFARLIFNNRRPIVDFISQSKLTLRDTLSSTQIYSVLRKNNVFIEVQSLKALLRELGFPFNGPSTSFALLFSACKAYIHGISGGYTNGHNLRSSYSVSEFSSISKTRGGDSTEIKKLLDMMRDMIYTSNTSLYDLFKEGATGGALDLDGFSKVFEVISEGSLKKAEIEAAFKAVAKNKNGKISFQTFEETFKSEVPTSGEFETKVIRTVR
jgi:Ca2+-binding EF-hand superfamily protein